MNFAREMIIKYSPLHLIANVFYGGRTELIEEEGKNLYLNGKTKMCAVTSSEEISFPLNISVDGLTCVHVRRHIQTLWNNSNLYMRSPCSHQAFKTPLIANLSANNHWMNDVISNTEIKLSLKKRKKKKNRGNNTQTVIIRKSAFSHLQLDMRLMASFFFFCVKDMANKKITTQIVL